MNSDLLRHKLLGILTRQYVLAESKKIIVIGVSFEEIELELKCSDQILRLSIAELLENKEIGYHDAYGIVGVYATGRGVAAFSNKKYWRINKQNKIKFIKDSIQIVIPVLSLIVAILAITIKIDYANEANRKLQKELLQRLEAIEKSQNIIQYNPKIMNSDSINIQ